MLNVKVDRRPHRSVRQVAGEIRRAIAEGEAKPGERLPPAKDLAAVLGVNTNTVLRALRLLRDEGLLEFRRGRGISVAGTPERGAVVQRAQRARRLRPPPGLPPRRARRDHRRRRLTERRLPSPATSRRGGSARQATPAEVAGDGQDDHDDDDDPDPGGHRGSLSLGTPDCAFGGPATTSGESLNVRVRCAYGVGSAGRISVHLAAPRNPGFPG